MVGALLLVPAFAGMTRLGMVSAVPAREGSGETSAEVSAAQSLLRRILHAEHGGVVVVGEEFAEARPADHGAQCLLGHVGRHVVLELVDEAGFRRGVAVAFVQHLAIMGRKRHVADEEPREDAFTFVGLLVAKRFPVSVSLMSPPSTSAMRRSCNVSTTGNSSSISIWRSEAISGRSALPL